MNRRDAIKTSAASILPAYLAPDVAGSVFRMLMSERATSTGEWEAFLPDLAAVLDDIPSIETSVSSAIYARWTASESTARDLIDDTWAYLDPCARRAASDTGRRFGFLDDFIEDIEDQAAQLGAIIDLLQDVTLRQLWQDWLDELEELIKDTKP